MHGSLQTGLYGGTVSVDGETTWLDLTSDAPQELTLSIHHTLCLIRLVFITTLHPLLLDHDRPRLVVTWQVMGPNVLLRQFLINLDWSFEHTHHHTQQLDDETPHQHILTHSYASTTTRMENLLSTEGNKWAYRYARSHCQTRQDRLVVVSTWSCRPIIWSVYGHTLPIGKIEKQRSPMVMQSNNRTMGSAIQHVGTQQRDRTKWHDNSQIPLAEHTKNSSYRRTRSWLHHTTVYQ